ncbi:hypothetical protein [Flavobacterium sp. Root420]|uniref:hypothetical protein n=1 Tax=Flavobacterium sp. Root420 TaxID=1736533 RepID=UPI0009EC1865|nr:hypothetical protein [Flavobacterium sp. Root420]
MPNCVGDEPTTGLHQSDTQKLLLFCNKLVQKNNTLIIVEHNLDVIAQADWIIDIGPGAGKYGGNVIFEGTVEELLRSQKSYTAQYVKKHLKLQTYRNTLIESLDYCINNKGMIYTVM